MLISFMIVSSWNEEEETFRLLFRRVWGWLSGQQPGILGSPTSQHVAGVQKEITLAEDMRLFGEVAFELQYITTSQLYEGLAIQARDEARGADHRFLGQILMDLGHLKEKQVLEVLRILHDRPRQGVEEK